MEKRFSMEEFSNVQVFVVFIIYLQIKNHQKNQMKIIQYSFFSI